MSTKKKICLAVAAIAVAVVGIVVGTMLLGNDQPPKADPLHLPAAENVTEVLVETEREENVPMGTEDGEFMLQYLRDAVATQETSNGEHPAVESYYTILIMEGETEHCYFLYEKDGTVYAELPYGAICTVDRLALDLVRAYNNG